MRIDIGRSRYGRVCAALVAITAIAAWTQIGLVRWDGAGGWHADLPTVLAALILLVGMQFVLRSVIGPGGRTGVGRRRNTRLVLLGHADARVYWQTDPGWQWPNARRKRAAVGGENDRPTSGIDDVCIVEMVQWGGFCLWLTVCPRYPAPHPAACAGPVAWFAGSRDRTRRWLCIPADAVTPGRFHALCARCRAMRRGAGFLSPW